ncbi:hypothetical protein NQ317_004713 [Molorchus minor]|uniref:Major facilitator superfamily (MFS) profile domain-containing protein n=1 Tax=Molorchus minor TaxID=1323400 RepID=A0ABQ9ITJ4_9CUCU|nr:hypothetical protein NQ317_004713 [Molorchus minor]
MLFFSVDLLATAGDVTLSWTSPIYPQIYSNDSSINPLGRPITEDEDAWIGSLLTIGAVVGPYPFSFIAETFGRKIGLLCIALPHIISYISMAVATNVYMLYVGRILGGIAMGAGYSLLPMYIAEITQDFNRGSLSQTMNVFWALGTFIPYAIGPFLSVFTFNLILALIPATFFIIFLLVGPESPYYLVSKNKICEAEKSLMKLRSTNKQLVQKELEHIRANLKKPQEMSGFCAISFYLQPIFETAGTGISPEISALAVGFSLVLTSFFTPLLIDRMGRKILTICSCFGMTLALTMLGAFFYIQDSTNIDIKPLFWIPIFSLMFYIFSYNLGIGCIPWTLCSELFPSNVKHISSTAVSSTCWLTSFLVTKFFNDMNNAMGKAVDLLATAGDVTLSWTSPVLPKLTSNDTSENPLGRSITEEEDAWIASLVTIGAMIGPYVAGFIAGHFGRKIGLLSLAIPHIVSLLTMAFATNIFSILLWSAFGGIAAGGGYMLLPMYIAEIAHDSDRGMLSQTLNVFWAFGNFIPYAIGPYLSIMWFNIVLACIPTAFFVLFLLFGPETPYYLVSVNKTKEATNSLKVLRSLNDEDVQKELEHIRENFKNQDSGRFSRCNKK